MNIAVCVKIAPDAEDLEVQKDGSISLGRAEWVIGGFDLQAVEAGVRLAEKTGGRVTAISVGPGHINQSRVKKDLLSRGPDELIMVVDDQLAAADTHQTAWVLAGAIKHNGPFDLILCGEGSSDLYFQQVGMQVGALLDYPVLNFISKIDLLDQEKLMVERTLEEEIEVLEVPLPAVLSVTSDIHPSRLPTMKDILKAGQKPVIAVTPDDAGFENLPARQVETLDVRTPVQVSRKRIILPDGTPDAARVLTGYLKTEGLI